MQFVKDNFDELLEEFSLLEEIRKMIKTAKSGGIYSHEEIDDLNKDLFKKFGINKINTIVLDVIARIVSTDLQKKACCYFTEKLVESGNISYAIFFLEWIPIFFKEDVVNQLYQTLVDNKKFSEAVMIGCAHRNHFINISLDELCNTLLNESIDLMNIAEASDIYKDNFLSGVVRYLIKKERFNDALDMANEIVDDSQRASYQHRVKALIDKKNWLCSVL